MDSIYTVALSLCVGEQTIPKHILDTLVDILALLIVIRRDNSILGSIIFLYSFDSCII